MYSKPASTMKRNPWGDDHPEKAREDTSEPIGLRGQIKNQLQDFVSPDAWFNQLFGQGKQKESYPQPKTSERPIRRQETLIFTRVHRTEEENLNKETQIILQQLKKQIVILEKSEKSLVGEIAKVKVEQMPAKKGIYYIRFLEWLLTVVRQLRVRVEEGRAWLATFTQKKKKRMGYWQMYKKHGTTFGLSHERTLATQTG